MINYDSTDGYSNAFHPLEKKLAEKALHIISQQRFPLNRLQLYVQFNDLATKPFDHALSLELDGRTSKGTCTLKVSTLALQQDPARMFDIPLIHEICHILSGCEGFNLGEKIKPHGPEWVKWMRKVGGAEAIETEEPPNTDMRPSALLGGALFCVCGCPPIETGITIGQRSKTRLQELSDAMINCEICNMSYKSVGESDIPIKLKSQVQMLKDLSSLRTAK